jgi:phospholipid/cholesterol/gamma-HCH transport system substrate-binding protein
MLLRDPSLYNNMKASIARIDSLVSQIQQGNGTTGALISNKELYEQMASTIRSLDSLIVDIKANPQKYLKVKVSLF